MYRRMELDWQRLLEVSELISMIRELYTKLCGQTDGHVRIWSTEAILQAGDPDYSKPKQLCHMSYHSGTIHTVRFSPNGRWLASGADDKIICIYQLDTNPPAHSVSFGMHSGRKLQTCLVNANPMSRNKRATPG
jgi:hypothetical protein